MVAIEAVACCAGRLARLASHPLPALLPRLAGTFGSGPGHLGPTGRCAPGPRHRQLLSYVAAGSFIWSNRRIPGVGLVGVGGALNIIAIVSNGGTMPASASALAASGWRPQAGHFTNSAVVAHPKLAVLGDVFATPRWLPAHDVFSIGDMLIVLAVAVLVYRTCTKADLSKGGETAGAGQSVTATAGTG